MTSNGGAALVPVQANSFVSVWRTNNAGTSTSTQITIPTVSTGTYNCVVAWGDGTTGTITTYNDAAWTHTYPSAGVYTVTITGVFVGILFNNGGDRLKLLSILQFGAMRLGNSGSYFFGCSNLTITATDVLNTSGTLDMGQAFRTCASLTTVPSMGSWNMSAVTNLGSTFNGCTNFNEPGVGSWNTSSVTSISSVFALCPSFNQPLFWNTGNVTNMASAFSSATTFNQVSITLWDVRKVTNLNGTFTSAAAFNQNIGLWQTSALTTMGNTFLSATAFQQDISSWDVSKVTTFGSCFTGATSFNQNLAAWIVTACTNFTGMFTGVTLSNANYNLLLNSWSGQAVQTARTFSGGNSHYDATSGGVNGVAARLVLTGTKGWTITDGGTP